MRIIAGTAKGRKLMTPPDDRLIRPTSDRTRETLFNVLGQSCEGLRVLDLFSGTGALALEALSRGAAHAVLADQASLALDLCQKNAELTGMKDLVSFQRGPWEKVLGRLSAESSDFDLVFVDPPYRLQLIEAVLQKLDGLGLVATDGRVVAECAKSEVLAERVGRFEKLDERRFGDTVVAIFSLTS